MALAVKAMRAVCYDIPRAYVGSRALELSGCECSQIEKSPEGACEGGGSVLPCSVVFVWWGRACTASAFFGKATLHRFLAMKTASHSYISIFIHSSLGQAISISPCYLLRRPEAAGMLGLALVAAGLGGPWVWAPSRGL